MATLADIANHVKNLKENDPVVLKLIHPGRGFFRTLRGKMKSTGNVPSMVDDAGELVVIRPIMIIEGKTYQYSSITLDRR